MLWMRLCSLDATSKCPINARKRDHKFVSARQPARHLDCSAHPPRPHHRNDDTSQLSSHPFSSFVVLYHVPFRVEIRNINAPSPVPEFSVLGTQPMPRPPQVWDPANRSSDILETLTPLQVPSFWQGSKTPLYKTHHTTLPQRGPVQLSVVL